MRFLLCLGFLVGVSHTAPTDVSPQLRKALESGAAPGIVAAVVSSDQLIAVGAAGMRKRGSKIAVTTGDKFHIGSCTKAMTATLCAMLVERGKLRWAQTLNESFPRTKNPIHKAYRGVTLEQLLSNHSGMPSQLDQDGLWAKLWAFQGTPTKARELLFWSVVKHPPTVPPGEKYLYSNAGFSVAGYLAETKTKKSWRVLMGAHLFTPLGMDSAGFGAPASTKTDELDQPWGHTAEGKPVPPGLQADNPTAIGPAGRVHCTIADWGKFAQLHLRGARGKSKLLKPDTFKKLHTPYANNPANYAMGWMATKRPWGRGTVLTHTGSNTMWFAVIWLAPEIDAAYLVICNQGGQPAATLCDTAVGQLIMWHMKQMRAKPKKAG